MRKVIEDHPIIALIVATAAAGSVIYGVVNHETTTRIQILQDTHKQETATLERQLNGKIADLEQQLTRIRRGLGKSGDLLDVRNFVLIKKEDMRLHADRLARAKYWKDEKFYAAVPENGSQWKYTKMSTSEFIGKLLMADPKSIAAQQTTMLKEIPLHVWSRPTTYTIERSPVIKRAFPYVNVRFIPNSQFEKLANTKADADVQRLQQKEALAEPSLLALQSSWIGDASGAFLALQLKEELLEPAPNVTSWLAKLQKLGNVVYAQIDTVLEDVRVNGVDSQEFYLSRELFIISTIKGLYVIKTCLPSADLRVQEDDAAWITNWFNSFLIDTASH